MKVRGFSLLPNSKTPLFASNQKRKDRYVVFYDKDGLYACANFMITPSSRICSICGNCCVQFVVDDHGEYVCSACGKFPRELIMQ